MKNLVSCEYSRLLERQIQESCHISSDILMENAARGMYSIIKDRYGGDSIVALCGGGNNGGDALAVLRHALFDGAQNCVAIVTDPPCEQTMRRIAEARGAGALILEAADERVPAFLEHAKIILDGLTGTGARGALRGQSLYLASLCGTAGAIIAAVDIPSGMFESCSPGGWSDDTSLVLKAHRTLTVAPAKAMLYYPAYRSSCGEIMEVRGVFPEGCASKSPIALYDESDLSRLLPVLAADMHKGDRGNLGIYAGSVGSTGAALLAVKAGVASGAGTVTLGVRDELYSLFAGRVSGTMVRPLSLGNSRDYQAMLIGPGLGIDDTSRTLLEQCWNTAIPLVVDADALRMLGTRSARRRNAAGTVVTVLTPHPGELAAIIANCAMIEHSEAEHRIRFDTYPLCLELARRFDSILVLKTSVSWIVHPDGRAAVYDGRIPALATGGSGDVLAGALAGLLARGMDPFDAATAATIAHGLAGRILEREKGFFDAAELTEPLALVMYGLKRPQRNYDGNTGER